MKKIILKSIGCLLLLSMTWGCSNENDTIMSDQEQNRLSDGFQLKDGSVWDGQIGEDRAGVPTITANIQEIKDGFEEILISRGNPVKIETVQIIKKNATNDPSDFNFFLIGGGRGTDNTSTSIGKPLTVSGGKYFISSGAGINGDPEETVSCRGCGTGCFIEYYKVDGHLVPYCDSAGCGPICSREKS